MPCRPWSPATAAGVLDVLPTLALGRACLEPQAGLVGVYCQLKLNLPRRTKKRLPRRDRQSLVVPEELV